MNPYRPEIQTEFAIFLEENENSEKKGGIYESPPDRYVPNSSHAERTSFPPPVGRFGFLCYCKLQSERSSALILAGRAAVRTSTLRTAPLDPAASSGIFSLLSLRGPRGSFFLMMLLIQTECLSLSPSLHLSL